MISLRTPFLYSGLLALGCVLPMTHAQDTDYKHVHELNERLGQAQAYRHREFSATLPHETAEDLYGSIHGSYQQNPFGISITQGESLECEVKNFSPGMALVILNLDTAQPQIIPLQEGVNSISAPTSGLCYFYYPSDTPAQQDPAQVTLKGGKINGIYNSGEGARTWAFMQKMPSSDYMELLSEHLHIILPKKHCAQLSPEDGEALLRHYESLYQLALSLVGQGSYAPATPQKLHILPFTKHSYIKLDLEKNPELLDAGAISEAHLHLARQFTAQIAQIIPAGQGELSAAIQQLIAELALRPQLEQESSPSLLDNNKLLAHYHRNIIARRQLWNASQHASTDETLLATMMPLCSLYTYFTEVKGDQNFLPRLIERLRLIQQQQLSPREWRCAFLMALCDASKCNLTRFFLTTRMLAPMNRLLPTGTSSTSPMLITMDDIKKVWQHASKYPEDECRAIHLAHPLNKELIRAKTPLRILRPTSLQRTDTECTIPVDFAEGAIAYELHDTQGKLALLILVKKGKGTIIRGDIAHSSIVAVGWDGTRIKISP